MPSAGFQAKRGSSWASGQDCSHTVQFYRDDRALIALLSRHVGTALVTGHAALVVGTRAHREALAAHLKARGLDVSVPLASGRYVALDAAETLATIAPDGWPDVDRFQRIVGGVLNRVRLAAEVAGPVAVFGEIVALLWASGNPESAIRLEELWNGLGRAHEFSLCCAYPMDCFKGEDYAARFMRVCAQHTHVFPAEGAGTIFSGR